MKKGKKTQKGIIKKIDWSKEEDRGVFWHSAAHVLAMAVKALFTDIKLTIGPTIENGFYYDFYKKTPFIPENLKKSLLRNTEKIFLSTTMMIFMICAEGLMLHQQARLRPLNLRRFLELI